MNIPKAELDKAIAEKRPEKVSQIVQAVLNNATQSYASAVAAFDYVEQQYADALTSYQAEETPIIENQTQWSEDYYFDQKVGLSYNFCRTRFEHLVAVAKYLESEGVESFKKRKSDRQSNEESRARSSLAKVTTVVIGAAIVVAAVAVFSD